MFGCVTFKKPLIVLPSRKVWLYTATAYIFQTVPVETFRMGYTKMSRLSLVKGKFKPKSTPRIFCFCFSHTLSAGFILV